MSVKRCDRGSASVEFVVIAPIFFIGFLAIVVLAGRVGQSSNDVRSAAHEAARAASLTATAGDAQAAAAATASENLASAGVACAGGSSVTVDTSNFVPGGWVTVTVTCDTPLSDMSSLGVPGSRTHTASASEVIDVLRSETP